mgnify:CR=1 FL=1
MEIDLPVAVPDLFDQVPCGLLALDADLNCLQANLTLRQWLGHARPDADAGARVWGFICFLMVVSSSEALGDGDAEQARVQREDVGRQRGVVGVQEGTGDRRLVESVLDVSLHAQPPLGLVQP